VVRREDAAFLSISGLLKPVPFPVTQLTPPPIVLAIFAAVTQPVAAIRSACNGSGVSGLTIGNGNAPLGLIQVGDSVGAPFRLGDTYNF
jgi:hypothetical protein